MEQKESENSGVGEAAGKVKILQGETSPLHGFVELNSQFHAMVDLRDGLRELFAQCQAWVAEESDFEKNPFKQAMVFSFYRMCNEELLKTIAELRDVELRAKAILKKIETEKVPHGHPTEKC